MPGPNSHEMLHVATLLYSPIASLQASEKLNHGQKDIMGTCRFVQQPLQWRKHPGGTQTQKSSKVKVHWGNFWGPTCSSYFIALSLFLTSVSQTQQICGYTLRTKTGVGKCLVLRLYTVPILHGNLLNLITLR